MAQNKVLYRCNNCGHETSRWQGKCLECDRWDALSVVDETKTSQNLPLDPFRLRRMDTAHPDAGTIQPIPTGIAEADRVFSGGLLPGSVTLLGGEPGIGKSTFLLQIAASMAKRISVMYVSAEEGLNQISLRAARLFIHDSGMNLLHAFGTAEILAYAKDLKPDLLIVDSVQTVCDETVNSASGSVTQVRAVTENLVKFAKKMNTAVIMAGHVTKDGTLAGPKVLEHLVDTVVSFEGDRHHSLRVLTVLKHRFGTSGETAIFSMSAEGLREIPDPSGLMLADRCQEVPGSVVVPVLEGQRSLLVELQALVVKSNLANPKRQVQGVAGSRLAIILAILEQRAGCSFSASDVFVSIVGGIKVSEPALDLPLALCLASAFHDTKVDGALLSCGELGLGGEVRQVAHLDKRLAEGIRLGFKKFIVPASDADNLDEKSEGNKIEIIGVRTLREALKALTIE